MGDVIGKAKEVAGWAAGDREVEAEGRVQQEADNPEEPVNEVTDEAVEEEQNELRQEHGEYDPST